MSCLLQNPFSSSHIHIYVLCVKVDLILSLGIKQLNEPPGSCGILKANVPNPNKSSWWTVKLYNNIEGIAGRVGEKCLVNLLKTKYINQGLFFQRELSSSESDPAHYPWALLKGGRLPDPKPEQENVKINWPDSLGRLLTHLRGTLGDLIIC